MNTRTNNLSEAELERLAMLAEECAEVIQCVNKIIRHGYEEYHPITKVVNRDDIQSEVTDLRACLENMYIEGDIEEASMIDVHDRLEQKRRYMWHQPIREDHSSA